MVNILVFGTSITYGCWDPEGGWVQRLRKYVDRKNIQEKLGLSGDEIYVYNLGISGDTTEWILQRFEFEAKQRDIEDEGTVVIFQLGKNDALFNNKTGKPDIAPQKFQENLEKIIKIAKKYTQKVIFIGSLPVDESRVDPVPWLPAYSYKNEYIKEYDEITKSTCRLQGADFLDLYSKFIDSDYKKLLEDGVHGNTFGHQVIFETVKDYLLERQILETE